MRDDLMLEVLDDTRDLNVGWSKISYRRPMASGTDIEK
jgi:hypothetical protein